MIKASGYTWIAAGAVIAGALLFVGARRAAGNVGGVLSSTWEAAGEMLNPASPQNVVNQAVLSAGQAVTGNDDWTLGGAFYGWLHPFEDYQATGDPAWLPWYAQPAGYGVRAGQGALGFSLGDLIAP